MVQEGLTNVRKHAPGAAARITLDGGPGAGLDVTIVNRLAPPVASGAVPTSPCAAAARCRGPGRG